MSEFNEALLAKQGWKCITQPNSLTAQILKAKYYPQTSFQEASIGNKNVSYTWRRIQKASWVLKKGGLWTIGNGDKIDIWHDNWLPRQHGYNVWSSQGNATQTWVKVLFIPNTKIWDRNLINRIFHQFEADQILQIPTNGSFSQDEFTWPLTKDGNYTVKSGYQAIQDWKEGSRGPSTSVTNNNNLFWQKLWKLKIPPKHITLLWRILHNALPVQDNLRRRGINCYPLCARCNSKIEDQNHVFCECDWAKRVWFGSPLTIRINENNPGLSKWIEDGLMNMTTPDMEIIGALCYHIWNARNQLIFRNNDIPATDVIQQAQQSILEYKQQQQIDTKPNQRASRSSRNNESDWIPPPRAFLKLNVDAHRLAGDGHWGIWLVLRREDGSCVGATTREVWGLSEVIEAEAMGLYKAVEFLKGIQQRDVIIELDNQVVVKAINDRNYPRKYWGQLARFGEFLSENPRSSIRWTRRTGNRVAHFLASQAAKEPNATWMGFAPPCINNHIQKDVTHL
jgi:ribonuclease HI